jgi:predicted O-methyltransferase YrrM
MNATVLAVLTKIDNLRKIQNTWNIDWETGQYLYDFVLKHKPVVILECGTSTGFSTLWLAAAADTYGGRVWTVESHEGRYELAKNHFEESGLQNIFSIKDHLPGALEHDHLKNIAPNFIFMDCVKNYYLPTLQSLENRLDHGSYIIADNILSHSEQTKDYIDYIKTHFQFESQTVNIGTGLEITKIIM